MHVLTSARCEEVQRTIPVQTLEPLVPLDQPRSVIAKTSAKSASCRGASDSKDGGGVLGRSSDPIFGLAQQSGHKVHAARREARSGREF
jgi:hypothetical protein